MMRDRAIALKNASMQSIKTSAGPAKNAPVPAAPLDDEVDEYEDFDPLAGLSSAAKRRVLALKETQTRYDEMNKEFQKELASLQAKYQSKYGNVTEHPNKISMCMTPMMLCSSLVRRAQGGCVWLQGCWHV